MGGGIKSLDKSSASAAPTGQGLGLSISKCYSFFSTIVAANIYYLFLNLNREDGGTSFPRGT